MPDHRIVAPTPRTVQMHGALSRRLHAIVARLSSTGRMGAGLGAAEVDQLSDSLRDLVFEARSLEDERGRRTVVNPDVPVAFEQLHQAEREIMAARVALRERLEEAVADPTGRIRNGLATAQRIIAEADRIIAGGARTRGAA